MNSTKQTDTSPALASLIASYQRATSILARHDWRGIEAEIAQTGEEDPLALVDDPGLKAVIAAKLAMRRAAEETPCHEPGSAEARLAEALRRILREAPPGGLAGADETLAELAGAAAAFLDKPLPERDRSQMRACLSLLAQFRGSLEQLGVPPPD